LSSNADGTRRTPEETIFLIAFLDFLQLIWEKPEAAWSSASETCSEVLLLRFDDSRDLVLEGWTPVEVVSSAIDGPLFEDILLGALMGAAEQLATTTAVIFSLRPGLEN
jgi:hypothetical protein